MSRSLRHTLLFLSTSLLVFALLRWDQRRRSPEIEAESLLKPGARSKTDGELPREFQPGYGCAYFQNGLTEYELESLAALVSMVPQERCMHSSLVLILGEQYFPRTPVDRWGREYYVDCHPGPKLVRVFSFGPDGKENTADDVGAALPWVPRSPDDFQKEMRERFKHLFTPAPSASGR